VPEFFLCVCHCQVWTDALFKSSLRLQIYRGLGIQPILDDRGNLDHALIESISDNLHVVKFGEGSAEEDLVERIWKLTSL